MSFYGASEGFALSVVRARGRMYSSHQMRTAAIVAGLASTLLYGTLFLNSNYNCDSSVQAVIVTEAEDTTVDPSTSILFPRSMGVNTPTGPLKLSLLGLGVRTVSFLKVQVYAVGFYADLEGVDLTNIASPEEKIEWLIRNRCVAVRIVPTRNTSHQHLRDAYMRSLQGRLAFFEKEEGHALSSEQEDSITLSLQTLKGLFPSTTLKKHTPLQIILSPPGDSPRYLAIPKFSGQVDNTWLGVELMRAYFEGDGVSPKMKKSVLEGVATL